MRRPAAHAASPLPYGRVRTRREEDHGDDAVGAVDGASLPESTEQDHHGMASFRVRGRIFATSPTLPTSG